MQLFRINHKVAAEIVLLYPTSFILSGSPVLIFWFTVIGLCAKAGI